MWSYWISSFSLCLFPRVLWDDIVRFYVSKAGFLLCVWWEHSYSEGKNNNKKPHHSPLKILLLTHRDKVICPQPPLFILTLGACLRFASTASQSLLEADSVTELITLSAQPWSEPGHMCLRLCPALCLVDGLSLLKPYFLYSDCESLDQIVSNVPSSFGLLEVSAFKWFAKSHTAINIWVTYSIGLLSNFGPVISAKQTEKWVLAQNQVLEDVFPNIWCFLN